MATSLARNGPGGPERIDFELSPFHAAVLDGYSCAIGMSRTGAAKKLLVELLDAKHREAVSIARVAGINPESTGNGRD
jgi:hypothetical protein